MGGLLRKLKLVKEPPFPGRRVAILLDSLTPELRERILRGLPSGQAEALQAYSSTGLVVSELERMQVLARELKVKLTQHLLDQGDTHSHLTASLQAVVSADSAKYIERFSAEIESRQTISIGEALEAIRVGNTWTRTTAIVLDSLSPATAEQVRRHLPLFQLRAMESLGRARKAKSAQERHRVLCFWLELDPTRHQLESVRVILETAAASNPERFAARSNDPWPWHNAPISTGS